MGCTGSKSAVVNGRSPAALARAKGRGDQKPDSNPPIENQKQELQRHDTEIDIISQITEERVILKALAAVKILKRKESCELLMDALSNNDMSRLQEEKWHRLLQKKFCTESRKQSQSADLKHWVVS